jgi:hypothetical protein
VVHLLCGGSVEGGVVHGPGGRIPALVGGAQPQVASGRTEHNPARLEVPHLIGLDQPDPMVDGRSIGVDALDVDEAIHAEGIHDNVHGGDRGQQQGRGRGRDPAVSDGRRSRA